jgi:hypothetical protein
MQSSLLAAPSNSSKTSSSSRNSCYLFYQRQDAQTRQAPDKLPDMLGADNQSLAKLVNALGENQMSVREMLAALGLRDRENFLEGYLNPAVKDGFIRQLYPDNLKHPRQKYLLTVKGIALYQHLKKS